MKQIRRQKTQLDKQALVQDGTMIQASNHYNSYTGYKMTMPTIKEIEGGTCLVTDEKYLKISFDSMNGSVARGERDHVQVKARLQLPAKDWAWYNCKWVGDQLKYLYKETDFVDEENVFVVGELIDVRAIGDFADEDEVLEGTVVAVNDTQMAVEVNGLFVVFAPNELASTESVSSCSEFVIDGHYFATTDDERE
ncbi:hypothetical protein VPHK566_0217 [Vibrio phage K566]